MRSRLPPLALAAGLGLAALSGSVPVLAQPSPVARAAADALFEDGRRLMGENKFAEACPKLEESQRISPGMGTLFNLSVCWEQIGRTASAWVGFREVAGQALAAGQAARERDARGRASALEPRLMRLKISVTAGAGVEVKRDGAVISPALWGTPVPLDPGKYRVSASAPGKEPWEITVQLDQPGGMVNAEVPPLLDRKPGTPPPPPPPENKPLVTPGPGDNGAVPPPPPPPPVEDKPRNGWVLPVAITTTVLGVGAIAGGVGLGLSAKSEYDATNSGTSPMCNSSNVCNAQGLNNRSDAVNKGNIGTGLAIGGSVLAAAGVVVWIVYGVTSHPAKVSASARSTARSVWATVPQIGVGPTGVTLRGAF